MGKTYAIGIDYGTQSGRAVLVDLTDGTEVADHVTPYPHGVIDEELPESGVKLEPDWALQHPADYIEVLKQSVPQVIRQSGIDPADIIGIGIDFTTCTMLPVNKEGVPLCLLPEYKDNPHSWVKLWKHHAAQEEADRINEIAFERGEKWMARYGGRLSSEWMFAKAWQTLNEAPDIYEAADQFLEAADWVTAQMTGKGVRNSCTAGYKAMWHKKDGYPDKTFFKALDPRLENIAETKLRGEVVPLGKKAGELSCEMAEWMGLRPGTAVAVAVGDAHAAVPGVGVVTPGKMVLAMGTSLCHMLLGTEEKVIEGMGGMVEDGIIPGYIGYEAGQAAVGDIFEWFVEEAMPSYALEGAKQEGIGVHEWLENRASAYRPGQTGLLALDWWNGNRSVLVNADLTGLIVGYTLLTKPEETYRTLLEATAFGTRKIIDTFHSNGLAVNELYACGGLPQKNRLLMQIYADVTGREIKVAASKQTSALGAAMFGAVAAGKSKGGYETIMEAAEKMAHVREETYKPIPQNVEIYEKLYREYSRLHDYFGRDENQVMKHLKTIQKDSVVD